MSSIPRDLRSAAIPVVTLLIFVLAIFALRRVVHEVSLDEILDSLDNVSMRALAESVLFACASYCMLTLYEFFALRGIGRRIPYRRSALTSFIAFSISHSSGLSALSGGSIRYRSYAPMGLTALEAAGIMTLLTVTFALGVSTTLGLSLLLGDAKAAGVLHLAPEGVHLLGALLLCLVAGYCTFSFLQHDKPVHLWGRSFTVPPLRITLGQLASSTIDLCFLSAALYVLISDYVPISYPAFVGVFVLAIQVGVLSNVPGGLGVFEAVLIELLPGSPSDDVLGGVVLYRLVYYIVPFFIAIVLLTLREGFDRWSRWRRQA